MSQEPQMLLAKAQRALRAAETLLHAGDPEYAAGRAYYAMLHACQALLRHRGLRYRKHSGVHAAFGQHFAKGGLLDPKYHRWLLNAYDARLRGDYDFEVPLNEETVAELIEQAREFLSVAADYLASMA